MRYKLACEYAKDSNQFAHLHNLIRVLLTSIKNVESLATRGVHTND